MTDRVPSPLRHDLNHGVGAQMMMEKGMAVRVWGWGGIDAPRRDELLLVLQPHEIRNEVKVLRVRANGLLFPRIPQLRQTTRFAFYIVMGENEHKAAHLDGAVIVTGGEEVRGRMHDAVDRCAAEG